ILASGLSFIGSIIAWAIVLVAVRAGVDPDATSQPLVTGLVDLMGVSLFYIASVALVGVV
ncbi:MAG: magnesium transporter, partial [Aeropyrum sp.]|nr:magnesium transporter [Aeropyrum sp.]